LVENSSLPPSLVSIRRVNATYLVARDHPASVSVRAQLDDVVRRDVAAACARRFGPLSDDADPSVWFVRHLAVDISVNAAWTPERLSEAWAAEVTRSLNRRLRHGDDGEEVLRFPNRAVWLAQFLRDLADGVAWSKWYYDSLDGLRALPLHAALREAICREPRTGEAALRQSAEDLRLETILRAMSDTDCRAVWRTFREQDAGTEAETLNAQHLRTVARTWQNKCTLEPNHRAALVLFFALTDADTPQRARPALRQAIAALLALVDGIHSARSEQFSRTLERGQLASLVCSVGAEGVESLADLLARDGAAVLEIAGELRSRKAGPSPTVLAGETETTFTPLGGVFFLLPHFAELGLGECAAVLPEFEGRPPLALVRFLVMLKCLGGARAPRAFFDPLLRELAGVPPDLNAESVRAWSRKVTRKAARDFHRRWSSSRPAPTQVGTASAESARSVADDLRYLILASLLRGAQPLDTALSAVAHCVLRSFAHRLPGFARSSATFLHNNFLDVSATVKKEPEDWQVLITPPPLHIVLALTGTIRQTCVVPWLNAQRVEIMPRE